MVFSAFKRMFGECVRALKWENIVREAKVKAATYNRITAVVGWNV